jgi:hypothetical protein
VSGNERPSFYREVEDKPPEFITRNDVEKRWMFEWTCSRLDDWEEEYEWRGTYLDQLFEDQLNEAYDRMHDRVSAAIRSANEGDIEPLRELVQQLLSPLPQVGIERSKAITRFVNLPKLPRGKKWTKPAKRPTPFMPPREGVEQTEAEAEAQAYKDRIELAAAEAPIVRYIWKEHYDKTNQPAEAGQLTPADIVAERWGVKPEEVLERLKRLEGNGKRKSETATNRKAKKGK